MESFFSYIAIAAAIIGAVMAVLYFRLLKRLTEKKDDSPGFLLLQDSLQKLSAVVDSKLGQSQQEMRESVQSQFSESKKLLSEISEKMKNSLLDVTKEQTKTNEATGQFMKIAEQLSNLEKVLKHQKQRGNLGEASLELILANI